MEDRTAKRVMKVFFSKKLSWAGTFQVDAKEDTNNSRGSGP